MHADLSASHSTERPKSIPELYRLAQDARADEGAGNASDPASAALLKAPPGSLADVLICLATIRLALEDLEGCLDPETEGEMLHENIKTSLGNIGRYLAEHPAAQLPADLASDVTYIACGAFEADQDELGERLGVHGGDYLAAGLAG